MGRPINIRKRLLNNRRWVTVALISKNVLELIFVNRPVAVTCQTMTVLCADLGLQEARGDRTAL